MDTEDLYPNYIPPEHLLDLTSLLDILSTSLLLVLSAVSGLHAYNQIYTDLTSTFRFLLGFFILFVSSELNHFLLRLGVVLPYEENYLVNSALCLDKLVTSSLLALGVYRILLTLRDGALLNQAGLSICASAFVLLHPLAFIAVDAIYSSRLGSRTYLYFSLTLLLMTFLGLYTRLRERPGSSTHPGVDKAVLLFLELQFAVLLTVILLFMQRDFQSQETILKYLFMTTKVLYPLIYMAIVRKTNSSWNKRIFPWLKPNGLERRMIESRTELTEFFLDEA